MPHSPSAGTFSQNDHYAHVVHRTNQASVNYALKQIGIISLLPEPLLALLLKKWEKGVFHIDNEEINEELESNGNYSRPVPSLMGADSQKRQMASTTAPTSLTEESVPIGFTDFLRLCAPLLVKSGFFYMDGSLNKRKWARHGWQVPDGPADNYTGKPRGKGNLGDILFSTACDETFTDHPAKPHAVGSRSVSPNSCASPSFPSWGLQGSTKIIYESASDADVLDSGRLLYDDLKGTALRRHLEEVFLSIIEFALKSKIDIPSVERTMCRQSDRSNNASVMIQPGTRDEASHHERLGQAIDGKAAEREEPDENEHENENDAEGDDGHEDIRHRLLSGAQITLEAFTSYASEHISDLKTYIDSEEVERVKEEIISSKRSHLYRGDKADNRRMLDELMATVANVDGYTNHKKRDLSEVGEEPARTPDEGKEENDRSKKSNMNHTASAYDYEELLEDEIERYCKSVDELYSAEAKDDPFVFSGQFHPLFKANPIANTANSSSKRGLSNGIASKPRRSERRKQTVGNDTKSTEENASGASGNGSSNETNGAPAACGNKGWVNSIKYIPQGDVIMLIRNRSVLFGDYRNRKDTQDSNFATAGLSGAIEGINDVTRGGPSPAKELTLFMPKSHLYYETTRPADEGGALPDGGVLPAGFEFDPRYFIHTAEYIPPWHGVVVSTSSLTQPVHLWVLPRFAMRPSLLTFVGHVIPQAQDTSPITSLLWTSYRSLCQHQVVQSRHNIVAEFNGGQPTVNHLLGKNENEGGILWYGTRDGNLFYSAHDIEKSDPIDAGQQQPFYVTSSRAEDKGIITSYDDFSYDVDSNRRLNRAAARLMEKLTSPLKTQATCALKGVHSASITALLSRPFYYDGAAILCGSLDGTISTYHVGPGKAGTTLRAHHGGVLALGSSDYCNATLSGGYDRAVFAWSDNIPGRPIFWLEDKAQPLQRVIGIKEARPGQPYIGIAEACGMIRVFDIRKRAIVTSINIDNPVYKERGLVHSSDLRKEDLEISTVTQAFWSNATGTMAGSLKPQRSIMPTISKSRSAGLEIKPAYFRSFEFAGSNYTGKFLIGGYTVFELVSKRVLTQRPESSCEPNHIMISLLPHYKFGMLTLTHKGFRCWSLETGLPERSHSVASFQDAVRAEHALSATKTVTAMGDPPSALGLLAKAIDITEDTEGCMEPSQLRAVEQLKRIKVEVITAVAYRPGDSYIYLGTLNGHVHCYSVESGQFVKGYNHGNDHKTGILFIALHPTRPVLAAVSSSVSIEEHKAAAGPDEKAASSGKVEFKGKGAKSKHKGSIVVTIWEDDKMAPGLPESREGNNRWPKGSQQNEGLLAVPVTVKQVLRFQEMTAPINFSFFTVFEENWKDDKALLTEAGLYTHLSELPNFIGMNQPEDENDNKESDATNFQQTNNNNNSNSKDNSSNNKESSNAGGRLRPSSIYQLSISQRTKTDYLLLATLDAVHILQERVGAKIGAQRYSSTLQIFTNIPSAPGAVGAESRANSSRGSPSSGKAALFSSSSYQFFLPSMVLRPPREEVNHANSYNIKSSKPLNTFLTAADDMGKNEISDESAPHFITVRYMLVQDIIHIILASTTDSKLHAFMLLEAKKSEEEAQWVHNKRILKYLKKAFAYSHLLEGKIDVAEQFKQYDTAIKTFFSSYCGQIQGVSGSAAALLKGDSLTSLPPIGPRPGTQAGANDPAPALQGDEASLRTPSAPSTLITPSLAFLISKKLASLVPIYHAQTVSWRKRKFDLLKPKTLFMLPHDGDQVSRISKRFDSVNYYQHCPAPKLARSDLFYSLDNKGMLALWKVSIRETTAGAAGQGNPATTAVRGKRSSMRTSSFNNSFSRSAMIIDPILLGDLNDSARATSHLAVKHQSTAPPYRFGGPPVCLFSVLIGDNRALRSMTVSLAPFHGISLAYDDGSAMMYYWEGSLLGSLQQGPLPRRVWSMGATMNKCNTRVRPSPKGDVKTVIEEALMFRVKLRWLMVKGFGKYAVAKRRRMMQDNAIRSTISAIFQDELHDSSSTSSDSSNACYSPLGLPPLPSGGIIKGRPQQKAAPQRRIGALRVEQLYRPEYGAAPVAINRQGGAVIKSHSDASVNVSSSGPGLAGSGYYGKHSVPVNSYCNTDNTNVNINFPAALPPIVTSLPHIGPTTRHISGIVIGNGSRGSSPAKVTSAEVVNKSTSMAGKAGEKERSQHNQYVSPVKKKLKEILKTGKDTSIEDGKQLIYGNIFD